MLLVAHCIFLFPYNSLYLFILKFCIFNFYHWKVVRYINFSHSIRCVLTAEKYRYYSVIEQIYTIYNKIGTWRKHKQKIHIVQFSTFFLNYKYVECRLKYVDNTLRPHLLGCPIPMGRSKLNKDRLHRSRCSPCSFRNSEFSIYSVAVIAFRCITLPSNELPLKLKRYYIYVFHMKTRISDRMSLSIFVDWIWIFKTCARNTFKQVALVFLLPR